MAYGNPGNTGPAGDYFSDGNTAAPAENEGKGEEMGEKGGEPTGILPKELMAGKDFKVGEEIVLKITAVHENDFEVEYASEEGKEKEGGEASPEMEESGGGGTAKAPSDDMASMMY